ncbi:hypothetical protein KKA53_03435 [Candidatus Dependentiae bacterium]|nr:hypothetical protein [Candidatus Dependentiae bacterium]
MNDVVQKGWLPKDFCEEFDFIYNLEEYLRQPNSFMLEPFAFSRGITVSDIENLALLNDENSDRLLPYFCHRAIKEIYDKLPPVDELFAMFYRDNEGRCWQELHCWDGQQCKVNREECFGSC